jgi:hypothetical protein
MGAALLAVSGFASVEAGGTEALPARHTRAYFRHDMWRTVRADHPAIVPVANAIRRITSDPLEQLVVVNDVTHLLVDYDDDQRVYGTDEFHATLDEMLAKRREHGWLYLRDDCDGRAVFAAHLLAALGIPWRLEASYWKEHAWVVARVNGVDYDLLDLRSNAPETNRVSYKLFGHFFVHPSHQPPPFAWRRAWAERTGQNFQLGMELGVLAFDSTPGHLHLRTSTDWTTQVPDAQDSPFDPRTLTASVAGFPYGESLHVGALAGSPAPAQPAVTAKLGVATGSANTVAPDAAAAR